MPEKVLRYVGYSGHISREGFNLILFSLYCDKNAEIYLFTEYFIHSTIIIILVSTDKNKHVIKNTFETVL